jgi:hypothetical protein
MHKFTFPDKNLVKDWALVIITLLLIVMYKQPV